MSSYENINYSLRPAKQIERKMLVETFRNLMEFGDLSSYRYIGFGSIYFSDFHMVHRHLGITDLISIEKDEEKKGRFHFNCPFNCIEIQFGHSSIVLPTLSWDQRTILWLDYDGSLTEDCLTDIDFFCGNCQVGSVLVITVNAHPDRFPPGLQSEELEIYLKKSMEDLKKRVGEKNVPIDITGKDLRNWGTAAVYRRIIHNQILASLNDKNGGRRPGNKIQYQQLFNFNYADGMKMLTVGGIIYDEGQLPMLRKSMFEERLKFVRTSDESYLIEVPSLTYKELRHLNSQLPIDDVSKLDAPDVPLDDLKRYAEVYRYFPMFAEAEI